VAAPPLDPADQTARAPAAGAAELAKAAPLGRVRIRAGRDDDATALMALIDAIWSEYPDKLFDRDAEAPGFEGIASRYVALDGRLWVAELDGAIIGSVALAPAETPAGVELQKLYVAKPFRRAGLGARLCWLLECEARRRAMRFIDLWSDVRLRDAHNLYERLGFHRGATTREYADLNRTVRYYYRKDLTPI
jgi:putative acetyltransferase